LKQPAVNGDEYHPCEKCAIAMNKGEDLVQSMSRDDVLTRFLMVSLVMNMYLNIISLCNFTSKVCLYIYIYICNFFH